MSIVRSMMRTWLSLAMALGWLCPSGGRCEEANLANLSDEILRGQLAAPLPYEVKRVFPEQEFRNPVEFIPEPGSNRILICQVSGEIFIFDPKAPEGERELILDLQAEIPEATQLYGMAFHPNYPENNLVYLCYVLSGEKPDGTQVIECRRDPETGRVNLKSSRLLISWLGGGHNGGSLQFGHDGYLYITSGDGKGPNPPDQLRAGQDCSNLLSSILRIDVDRRDPGLAYRIPPDNPFSDSAGIRPEIWSYGYRNPWRMSFDRQTGELWVGDVGWDTWELVYYVRRGDNFGWSIMEGRQPINVTWERGPTPISPPMVEHPHSEARSITGGYVYYGKRLPELEGAYVYGDYETGKIWALWHRQGERTALREIADTTLRIICFGQTHDGEIYVVDYAGGIYELWPRSGSANNNTAGVMVPQHLSETGLFQTIGTQSPAAGLIPYAIEHSMWSDGLSAQRWLGLPSGEVHLDDRRNAFPDGAVLVKTLSTADDEKPVETQILQKVEGFWRAFSYAWNEDHTDAELVPSQGARRLIRHGESRVQPWHHVSRSECFVCHNAHVGGVLGFSSWQLTEASRERLFEAGYLSDGALRRDSRRNRASREVHAARTYLDVNCASCHRQNGGGLVPMELERHLLEERLHAIDVPPQRGDFGIREARVIDPGRPERSTLYYRMAKTGSGRMPHLGSQVVDERGLRLIYDWIESLNPDADRNLNEDETVSRALLRLHAGNAVQNGDDPWVTDLVTPAPLVSTVDGPAMPVSDPESILRLTGNADRGRALLFGARGAICLTCHQVASIGREFGPPFDGMGARRSKAHLLDSLLNPSREIETAYVNYTVTSRGGDSYTGFIRNHGSEGLVLRDAGLEEVEVPVDSIVTMTASDISVMPSGLGQVFSEQETADLLAYLGSLR